MRLAERRAMCAVETPWGGTADKQKRRASLLSLFVFRYGLFAVVLVRYGQLLAALCTAGCQYTATVGGGHSLTETMLVVPSAVVGLECSFHCYVVFTFVSNGSYYIFGLQN